MRRSDVLKALYSIMGMSENEIAMNARHIQRVAAGAAGHVKNAAQVVKENRKLRAVNKNLSARIKNLEARIAPENMKTNAQVIGHALLIFDALDEMEQETVADYIACCNAAECNFNGIDTELCRPCIVNWLQKDWEG